MQVLEVEAAYCESYSKHLDEIEALLEPLSNQELEELYDSVVDGDLREFASNLLRYRQGRGSTK